MSNIYLGYHFIVEPKELGSEILIAELGEKAFESFVETETGFSAFVQKSLWTEDIMNDVYILENPEFKISYTFEEIEQVNWNEEWEKNFEAIDVNGNCHVRAPFHPKTDAEFDIVIEPKMSFGTGHHETTHMMIQHLLEIEVTGMKTLDMGCGTAILAILAEMKGAQPIDAIDIDNWCYLNSIENAERNNCKHITVYEGDAALLKDKKYDLIIANINRNILLNDMQAYVDCLSPKGTILFSGFYTEDIPFINASCTEKGLTYVKKFERNNWVSLKYVI
ncbi:50S ribosomal protein L11 methyltransferase [Flavobacterium psychrophilum]|uniref:Ribosomal protein L11 methyltransferase n=1 Tax=Flavobacterium psychrophilum TaxID=96345 RepID=A0A7U2NCX6_FLAPS|nr:50S ribosomal protein L11 methyltransferase [Flavobacterium psychrophilum]ELM3642998.1 50S ribosomal protein L11 methyltransferase [Flavobacterium psychrophilum]ELV7525497.1 50S ribosomal protein L11 methyltransferase [Flavobacterium psychrophilum]ELY2010631.1 50S ribosomal protein L11 methyltransferase [Flavobacterium psychrophilum]MBF2092414.1 50S ribosomal protein L11 methyltransferase [Flavobacterium psychrophilum]OAE92925.1 ribosomal protein L11 methyltransferase [Flavobacterium psychr